MEFNNKTRYIITGVFILTYVIGWACNGTLHTNFDLMAIAGMYGCLVGKEMYSHTINSIYNSPKGELPAKPAQPTSNKTINTAINILEPLAEELIKKAVIKK